MFKLKRTVYKYQTNEIFKHVCILDLYPKNTNGFVTDHFTIMMLFQSVSMQILPL